MLVLSVNCLICNDGGYFDDTGAYQGLTAQERERTATADPNSDATHAFTGQEYGAARGQRVSLMSGMGKMEGNTYV